MPAAMERAKSMPLPDHIPPHPPAQKVAGRRMSMSSRARAHASHPEHKGPAADTAQNDTGPTDYPRPAAPGEQPAHEHHQHEEEQPKRERKHHGMPESERKAQEALQRRVEHNRPSREFSNKTSANVRIAQPGGKVGL